MPASWYLTNSLKAVKIVASRGAASFSKTAAAREPLSASASSITSLLALRAASSDCFAFAISSFPFSESSSFSSLSMAALYCTREASICLFSSCLAAGVVVRIMLWMLEMMVFTDLADSLASWIFA